MGCELAKRSTRGNHAYIVCTHIDKAHILELDKEQEETNERREKEAEQR